MQGEIVARENSYGAVLKDTLVILDQWRTEMTDNSFCSFFSSDLIVTSTISYILPKHDLALS